MNASFRRFLDSTSRRLLLLVGSIALSSLLVGCMEEQNSTASISGTVTDDVGVPVGAAKVLATASSTSLEASVVTVPALATSTTDSKGNYTLEVPEGNVRLSVSKDGFAEVSNTLTASGRGRGRGRMHFDMPGQQGGPMARMDTDGDGKIAQSEWKGPADEFLKIDTDADGHLSEAELEAGRKARMVQHPGRGPMDTDSDGLIARSEWMGPAGAFDEIDTDKSGTLSQTELDSAMIRRGPGGRGGRG